MSSKLINKLSEISRYEVITLETIANSLREKAIVIICFISIIPFMQPIPLPGLSSFLGFITLLQGMALMFLKKPFLTEKMKQFKISHEKFNKILHAARKLSTITEKFSIFRHNWTNSRVCHFICGLGIVISSAFLSLPLPIPLSNFIPAMSIALICMGLIEEDIFLIISGLSISVAIFWMGLFSYYFIIERFPALMD